MSKDKLPLFSEANMPPLLPCPFCQVDMKVLKDHQGAYKPFGMHSDECAMEGNEIKYTCPIQLAESWNTREPLKPYDKSKLNIVMIDLSLISLPSYADTLYPQDKIDTMTEKLNVLGWPTNFELPAKQDNDKAYHIEGGYDWLTAAKQSKLTQIPCVIY